MKRSAGILLFREIKDQKEFFLVHPGGPFFTKKDAGWWTIPKGEILQGEQPLETALREFEEETGSRPKGPFIELSPIKQKGGKEVMCWAAEGDLNPETIVSNTFIIEWPPRSGKQASFPEIDRAGWFPFEEARLLINERQIPFLEEMMHNQNTDGTSKEKSGHI